MSQIVLRRTKRVAAGQDSARQETISQSSTAARISQTGGMPVRPPAWRHGGDEELDDPRLGEGHIAASRLRPGMGSLRRQGEGGRVRHPAMTGRKPASVTATSRRTAALEETLRAPEMAWRQ